MLEKEKSMRVFCFIALAFIFSAVPSFAQNPPAPLPGYTISFAGGYSATMGNQTNNGFWASVALPVLQLSGKVEQKYGMNIAARGDYFSIAKPNNYVVTGGPEFRLQYSKPSLLNGQAFQPFINVGFGATRSQCVAAQNCAPAADQSAHFAAKVGFGLDLPMSSTMSVRILEFDYVHMNGFLPNNVVITNAAQLSAGLAIKF